MRKILILLLILLMSFSLTGCFSITVDVGYELHQETSEVESIILWRCNDNNTFDQLPLMSLPANEISSFVQELEALPFEDRALIMLVPAAVDPSFHFGEYVICVFYSDGSVERISNGGYQQYEDADGGGKGFHYSIDGEVWDEFLQKHFSPVLGDGYI